MNNWNDRPLGELAEEAYELLLEETEPGEGIEVEEAYERLSEAGFADGDPEYAVEKLLNRGYLYEVGDRLLVTDHAAGSA